MYGSCCREWRFGASVVEMRSGTYRSEVVFVDTWSPINQGRPERALPVEVVSSLTVCAVRSFRGVWLGSQYARYLRYDRTVVSEYRTSTEPCVLSTAMYIISMAMSRGTSTETRSVQQPEIICYSDAIGGSAQCYARPAQPSVEGITRVQTLRR